MKLNLRLSSNTLIVASLFFTGLGVSFSNTILVPNAVNAKSVACPKFAMGKTETFNDAFRPAGKVRFDQLVKKYNVKATRCVYKGYNIIRVTGAWETALVPFLVEGRRDSEFFKLWYT